MNSLKERFLAETFVEERTIFASSRLANNKIEADRMTEETFSIIAKFVGRLALQLEPDVITFIPDGARRLAEAIAHKHKLPVAYTKVVNKRPGQRTFDLNSFADKKIVEASKRLVAVEDVSNTDLSLRSLMEIEGVRDSLVGRVCILDRGLPEEKVDLPLPITRLSLFTEPMPALMSASRLEYYQRIVDEAYTQ